MAIYFAYGSNMDRSQLEDRVDKTLPRGVARLDDYEVRFNKRSKYGSGKANIVWRVGSSVEGGLYELTDEQLADLDEYEIGYHRVTVIVTRNGTPESVVTYMADPDQIDDNLAPSAKYLETIKRGAQAFGLSREYQERLTATKTR